MAKKSSKKKDQNVIDVVTAPPVVSEDTTNTTQVEPETETEVTNDTNTNTEKKMATFQFRVITKMGLGSYSVPGSKGVILVSPALIAENEDGTPGTFPAEIEIGLVPPPTAAKVTKSKLTKEERIAIRAALTPEQKLLEQEARLEKQRANLLKRKAALGIGVPAEGTTETETETVQ